MDILLYLSPRCSLVNLLHICRTTYLHLLVLDRHFCEAIMICLLHVLTVKLYCTCNLKNIGQVLNRVISPWSDFLGEGGHYCVKVVKIKMPLSLNNGAMAYWLRCWITNLGVPCSNPLRDSKDNSASHPSEVDQMYTRNSWELSGKSQTASTQWLCSLDRVKSHSHKRA